MKGLILKDLFTLRRQAKVMIFILVFYSFYAIMMQTISFLGGMVALMCAMMPISTLSYDEYCKWDRYALSMSVTRKSIVLSKYLLGIMLDIGALLLITPVSVLIAIYTDEMEIGETMLIMVACAGVAIVILALILPVLFKFGVEKGRMLMMLVIFVPIMLLFFISKLGLSLPSERTLRTLAYFSPVAVFVILLISISISTRIYEKKEF